MTTFVGVELAPRADCAELPIHPVCWHSTNAGSANPSVARPGRDAELRPRSAGVGVPGSGCTEPARCGASYTVKGSGSRSTVERLMCLEGLNRRGQRRNQAHDHPRAQIGSTRRSGRLAASKRIHKGPSVAVRHHLCSHLVELRLRGVGDADAYSRFIDRLASVALRELDLILDALEQALEPLPLRTGQPRA